MGKLTRWLTRREDVKLPRDDYLLLVFCEGRGNSSPYKGCNFRYKGPGRRNLGSPPKGSEHKIGKCQRGYNIHNVTFYISPSK